MTYPLFGRSHRHQRRPARDERRYHHPSYAQLNSQGWKATEAEEKLSDSGYKRELEWSLSGCLPI